MEVRKQDNIEWYKLATELGKASVNSHPDLIAIVSEVFKVQPIFAVVYHKEKPVLGIIAYCKSKSIVHPTSYIHTAVWQNSSSALVIQEAFIEYIKFLKVSYRFMEFQLPPEIFDVRPFIFTGFKPHLFYTYINKLSDIKLKSDVRCLKHKAERLSIQFNWDNQEDDILRQHVQSFINLGYSKNHVKRLSDFIFNLHQKGFLKAISARKETILLALLI